MILTRTKSEPKRDVMLHLSSALPSYELVSVPALRGRGAAGCVSHWSINRFCIICSARSSQTRRNRGGCCCFFLFLMFPSVEVQQHESIQQFSIGPNVSRHRTTNSGQFCEDASGFDTFFVPFCLNSHEFLVFLLHAVILSSASFIPFIIIIAFVPRGLRYLSVLCFIKCIQSWRSDPNLTADLNIFF